jgi:hypothetical protein
LYAKNMVTLANTSPVAKYDSPCHIRFRMVTVTFS